MQVCMLSHQLSCNVPNYYYFYVAVMHGNEYAGQVTIVQSLQCKGSSKDEQDEQRGRKDLRFSSVFVLHEHIKAVVLGINVTYSGTNYTKYLTTLPPSSLSS